MQFSINLVEWKNEAEALTAVRHTVFVVERGVPVEIERDPNDADAQRHIHIAARDETGNIIGTGRLVLSEPLPRIGRMAVLKAWRRHGVGAAMLDMLCAEAQKRGYEKVTLHAQTHAAPFYYKHGFLSHGGEFLEAGIPHLEMRKTLVPDGVQEAMTSAR
ncbi:MAG: GNAT family N-acetyltransferase [Betaproteobacteria bacterium]|nr:GNAT family N-acetyltransferase [Betaproteobacteria bacterium]